MTSALDAVPGGVFTLSHDLRILAANRTMAELVGRDVDALVGQFMDVVLSAPARILFQTHVYPALRADGRVEEVFLTLTSSLNEPIPTIFNATRSTSPGPETYEALVVRMRARARWEQEILAATRELERERSASARLAAELAAAAEDLEVRYAEERRLRAFRDAFVGVVGHELRNPVTTIYGMTNLLRRRLPSLDQDDVTNELADIEAEADRLRRLTEDLLVLSRAEAGRLVVARDPIVLARAVRAAVASERARAPHHEFHVEDAADLPLVRGEQTYVEQVLRNYLSNAVKYSPGGTTVHVRLGDESGGAAVRIVDAGPGLPDGDPERLFELFYRAPDAVKRSGGAGIGLFVCRELIRAMGGRTWARSARPEGLGAEFGFWLPAMAHEDATADC